MYSGDAIKCFECSSMNDPSCGDSFTNTSIRSMDCTQKHTYDLTPIESCLKIKHKGEPDWNTNHVWQHISNPLFFIPEGDRWIYERGCDRKDKPQFKEAQFYWCTANYCNAADNNQPKSLLTLLFTSLFLIKLWHF